MIKIKKSLAVILSAAFVITACATNETPPEITPPIYELTEEESGSPALPQPSVSVELDLSSVTSVEMARLMGYGINLGNTMEACDYNNRIPTREPSIYETMWGQPITTQEMITGYRDAGFTSIRIPVAWTNAMDFENGDYTINEAYLARVGEIIDYALNAGLYVKINDHWDHGWWSMFGAPQKREIAMDIFIAMWTQIAEYYKDYDHRLIFAPANEEWGHRFNDRTVFTDGEPGVLTEDECYELLTELGQVFIDTIRGTGGFNADRFLVIPGFNTDVEKTVDSRFIMPIDPAGRLMIDVHYYTPWSYCGDTAGVSGWGTTGDVSQQNELLGSLSKFVESGYGVILGEWGVLDNDGEDRYNFYYNFLTNCDLYGYVPMLWDTGGLYDKENVKIREKDSDIAQLFESRGLDGRGILSEDDFLANAESEIAWMLRKSADRPEFVYEANEAFAWIMFSGGDWEISYSVGDAYKPESITKGIVAVDAEVLDAGTYTVSLDFTGTGAGFADGIAFSAVGIVNAEILFPGYYMEITELLINGEPAEFSGLPYTSSDNGVTTRVNLYNEWVSQVPDEARTLSGDLTGATPTPLENYRTARIETLSVTFEYVKP